MWEKNVSIKEKEMFAMKKIYINPQVEIMNVSTTPLMHASIDMKGNYGDGSGITLGSRRAESSIWDDDDNGQSEWLQ